MEYSPQQKDAVFKYWDKLGPNVNAGKYFGLDESTTIELLHKFWNSDGKNLMVELITVVRKAVSDFKECNGDEFSLTFDYVVPYGSGNYYEVGFRLNLNSPVLDTQDWDDWEDLRTLYGQIETCVEDMLTPLTWKKHGLICGQANMLEFI